MRRWRLDTSERLVLSFALLIAIGTGMLCLPQSSAGEEGRSFMDSLFTSTSAVCVTGLAINDPGRDYSAFGQGVLLLLIQLGGLGILTLSNWVLLALAGRGTDPETRYSLAQTHGSLPRINPATLLRRIITFTAAFEGMGACLLYSRFRQDPTLENPVWCAVFHSVSAFCNAGFSLFTTGLAGYREDVVVNLTVVGLIISGGLGFVVYAELFDVVLRRRKGHRSSLLSYHSTVVITTTLALIFIGWAAALLLESGNAFTGASASQKSLDALFLSVTSRTAGFNTVDTGALGNATLCVLMLLMGIGASPGSTGGGIKTTSFALLVAFLYSRWRGKEKTEWMGRSVSPELVSKAVASAAAFGILTLGAVFLIEFIEVPMGEAAQSRGLFLEHLFEIVSALATVGLSTGITANLHSLSHLVLVFLMFTGRLGPLLIANSFIGKRKKVRYTLPEDQLMVG